MKSTMKRTLGLFAAALLTMSLALSVYASGHDLTFTDKGNRMHVKDKTVHVQTYYPYEYHVLDVLEDALVVANPEWDDCGFAVCRRITNEYLDYTGSDDDFVLDYAEEYLEYDFQQLYGGQWPDTSWEVVDESNASNRIATMRGYIWNDEMDAYMWTVIYWDTSYNNAMAKTFFVPEYNGYTQNLSYPVYIVWYTTGSGEDQREWMVYTVDTDDYTYLYAFGTIADEADDMQDVFYNICDHLELVD